MCNGMDGGYIGAQIVSQTLKSIIKRKRKSKVTTEIQCFLSEGLYCQKDQDCNICKRGILTKKVQPLETKHCGMGLFASEDINENEYIIEYTGPIY